LTNYAATSAAAIALVGVLVWSARAGAHHSFAPHFDRSTPVSIAGTVKEFEARNPHSYLHMIAVDENGRTREYVCESHGFTQLSRNGITADMLKAGTKIRVTGPISRHDPYMCFFETVEFADGRALSVNGPAQAGRSTAGLPPRKNIFGSWLLTPAQNRGTAGARPSMMQFLTPAGQRAVDAYDPFRHDPTFRCDPVAIRRVWAAPGTPLQIVRDGRNIVLRHEWMDVRRLVSMDVKERPTSSRHGSLGYSVGRIERETLVIETANYAAGVLNQYVEQAGQPTRGLLHSAALRTVERVVLDAARQRLVVEIDETDPEFFTQPFPTIRYEYVPSDLKIEPFNCSREGLTGTLRKR
jgi:hypothetical protein